MKKTVLMLLSCTLVAALMTSCGKYPGYKKTDGGLYYKFHKDAEGEKTPQLGDILVGEIIVHTEDSVLFHNTGTPDKIFMIEKPWFAGDINEGLMLMSEGDSATFIVSADSLRKMMPLPDFVKDNIRYTVKLNKILTKADQDAEVKMNIDKEKEAIAKYITEKGITTPPTESGIYFIETKKGTGAKVEAGKTVKFNYTGALLDGKIFDSSNEKEAFEAGIGLPQREYKPLEVPVGVGQVIPGMDEALMKMQVGGKAKVIIPSSLAYGGQANASIPAYSTLVFTIEVVGVQ